MNKAKFILSVHNIVTLWAYFGGTVLIAVVLINILSIVGLVFGLPFPGDFELTALGVGIAVFAFLPYSQITGSNISADIFTSRASKKTITFLKLSGIVLAFIFSTVLLVKMYSGMLDLKQYGYSTTILQIPQWLGYIPILLSLFILSLATTANMIENFQNKG